MKPKKLYGKNGEVLIVKGGGTYTVHRSRENPCGEMVAVVRFKGNVHCQVE
jgi:hypothetical protein